MNPVIALPVLGQTKINLYSQNFTINLSTIKIKKNFLLKDFYFFWYPQEEICCYLHDNKISILIYLCKNSQIFHSIVWTTQSNSHIKH